MMGEGLKIQTMLYSPYEFSPSVGIYSRGVLPLTVISKGGGVYPPTL